MSQNTFPVSIFDVPSNQINVQCLNIKSTSPRNHFRMHSRITQDFWNETNLPSSINRENQTTVCLTFNIHTWDQIKFTFHGIHNKLIHIHFSTCSLIQFGTILVQEPSKVFKFIQIRTYLGINDIWYDLSYRSYDMTRINCAG